MNVPIRFRGKRVDTGEYVFGFYQKNSVGDTFITDEHFIMNCVDPDSVAQLCGYDADDNEVYEGDTIIRYDSENEFIEAPENGVLRKVVLYTQVNPDLKNYYCFLKEATI